MFETLRADIAHYDQVFQLQREDMHRVQRLSFLCRHLGLWAVVDYRFRRWVFSQPRWVRVVARVPIAFLHLFVEMASGVKIPTECQIGPGLLIPHFSCIVLYDDVVIGSDCTLLHGVTIGQKGPMGPAGAATIGDRVYIGAGAKILGPIIIGSDVIIGANAVVIQPVPDHGVAVGIPARVLPKSPSVPAQQHVVEHQRSGLSDDEAVSTPAALHGTAERVDEFAARLKEQAV